MPQIISISEAKQKFLAINRRLEDLGESYIVVRDSTPVSALIPFDEYEALLETLDILDTEPNILGKLRAAENEIKKGKYTIWKPAQAKKKPTKRK